MKTRKKDIKLALLAGSTANLVKKIRREMPPTGKPFVDKRRVSKLDLTGRKAKHKTKDLDG